MTFVAHCTLPRAIPAVNPSGFLDKRWWFFKLGSPQTQSFNEQLGQIYTYRGGSSRHFLYASKRETQGSSFELPTTQRCRSQTEENILEDFLRSLVSQLKKYHPSGSLKLNNLDIFQSLKLRI